MRILKRKITSKNGSGTVLLQADEADDMYQLYNLLAEGDRITADTSRNVIKETNSGASTKKKVNMRLTIEIERIEFDSEQCSLRINGRNMEENEYVKMFQYHTLDIELKAPIQIEKDCWDAVFLQELEESCDVSNRAELAAVVMQDGLANICLITASMTVIKAKIEKSIPNKRQGGGNNSEHEKAKTKFYKDIFEAVKKHINFEVVRAVLVGSPGNMKDEFMAVVNAECSKQSSLDVCKHKSRFVTAHTSCGQKRAVGEMLGDPELQARLTHVKAAGEVRALQSFQLLLSTEPDRVCYSAKDVTYADSQFAVDSLLISDQLFKATDVAVRQTYVALVESVKHNGGKVHIFSSLHSSGEQLAQYSGVAALLRYPLVMPEAEATTTTTTTNPPSVEEKNEAMAVLLDARKPVQEQELQFTKHDESVVDMLGTNIASIAIAATSPVTTA